MHRIHPSRSSLHTKLLELLSPSPLPPLPPKKKNQFCRKTSTISGQTFHAHCNTAIFKASVGLILRTNSVPSQLARSDPFRQKLIHHRWIQIGAIWANKFLTDLFIDALHTFSPKGSYEMGRGEYDIFIFTFTFPSCVHTQTGGFECT